MEEKVYREDFTKVLKAEDVDYKIAAVLEAHPADKGWVAGEPRVEPVAGDEVRLIIPLAKYPENSNKAKML